MVYTGEYEHGGRSRYFARHFGATGGKNIRLVSVIEKPDGLTFQVKILMEKLDDDDRRENMAAAMREAANYLESIT